MIKIKKKHISEAKKMYKGNEKSFIRKIHYFKNITKEERIECIAEMFADCEERMKRFGEKYPNGFPELEELKCNIEPLKCNMEEIDWSSSGKWKEEEDDK